MLRLRNRSNPIEGDAMKNMTRAKWLFGGALGFGALTIASIATGGEMEPVVFALLSLVCVYAGRYYSKGE